MPDLLKPFISRTERNLVDVKKQRRTFQKKKIYYKKVKRRNYLKLACDRKVHRSLDYKKVTIQKKNP